MKDKSKAMADSFFDCASAQGAILVLPPGIYKWESLLKTNLQIVSCSNLAKLTALRTL